MIKIVTDSVADLPEEVVSRYDITVLPLFLTIHGETYEDGVDISSDDVCAHIREGTLPKTSQITPVQFREVFDRLSQNGDSVIAVTMSSQLSSTYQSAVVAREELPDRSIEVLDSKGVSLGEGLQAVEAAQMAELGYSVRDIVQRILQLRERMSYAIIIDTLEYLMKGGRISRMQYIAGNLMNLNLVCSSDGTGKITVAHKFRGKEKSLLKWAAKHIAALNPVGKTVGLNAITNDVLLNEVKNLLETYNPKEIIVSKIGSTVACYTGPNALGIFVENSRLR